MSADSIKAIAIHLPQFHPIPENDIWWGKGFTEWTNVTKVSPFFKGHYQPHLPADLGFYDLRLAEAREEQARLAQEYGIYGFCYYHYWFNGKRLLNRPVDEIVASKKPSFPFMVCWANENWTRRWDGMDSEILMDQKYEIRDDVDHMRFLCEHLFSDPRYIRVNNKPFFVLYRPALNPHLEKTIEAWRTTALKLGLGELYLGFMYTKETDRNCMIKKGFDCAIEFQPDFRDLSPRISENLWNRALHRFKIRKSPLLENSILDYRQYAEKMMAERKVAPHYFPGISPMWDNSARRKKGATIFKNSDPEIYYRWLSHIVDQYADIVGNEKFIFINAWNEWAEGNHLEPCQRWGRKYLEATRKALAND